jgi:hypothetical protein
MWYRDDGEVAANNGKVSLTEISIFSCLPVQKQETRKAMNI